MRSDEDEWAVREPVEEPRPRDAEPPGWEQGPQTAAERVAARRRLDRLADGW